MTFRRCIAVIILIIIATSSACGGRDQRPDAGARWQPEDLRLLETPNAGNERLDLIAAYARQTKTDLEIRVDILGSPALDDYDLYVVVGRPSGSNPPARLPLDLTTALDWAFYARFPAHGMPSVALNNGEPSPSLRPRILRDGLLDCAVVRFRVQDLADPPETLSFEVFLASPGERAAADKIGPALVDGPQANYRAPAYLAFWDALPSATPGQALRRWNGAHTGPFGQRHGLKILLQAAKDSGIPVTVLDLARPETLAALDYLDGLDLLKQMQRDGVLSIPALVYGSPSAAELALQTSRQAAKDYRLTLAPVIFGPLSETVPEDVQAAYARLEDPSHLLQWENTRLIPLPQHDPIADEVMITEGLPVSVRKKLLAAALSPDPGDVVPIGGSLPSSPWGDQAIAKQAFGYLAGHPWIDMLDSDDLLHFPASAGSPDCIDLLCNPSEMGMENDELLYRVQEAVRQAPQDLFPALARRAYLHLSSITTDPQEGLVRAAYLDSVVGPLLAAADWEKNPRDQAGCTEDLDRDGIPECVLSNRNQFAVLDPQGGRLILLAARKNGQAFQIIGPRAQAAVGLGDPTSGEIEAGSAIDPQDIPGGFADQADPWRLHRVEVAAGYIAMIDAENHVRKTYSLTNTGLLISIDAPQPVQTQLPILLLSEKTLAPNGYANYKMGIKNSPDAWSWQLARGPGVSITANNAVIHPLSFIESKLNIHNAEDPDISYPPGHFLPFPMALLDIQPNGSYSVQIELK